MDATVVSGLNSHSLLKNGSSVSIISPSPVANGQSPIKNGVFVNCNGDSQHTKIRKDSNSDTDSLTDTDSSSINLMSISTNTSQPTSSGAIPKLITNKPDSKLMFYELIESTLRTVLEDSTNADVQPNSLFTVASDTYLPLFGSVRSTFPRARNESNCAYMLQPSLFPLVYPCIYFANSDQLIAKIPPEMRQFMRWKMTTITANTMKAIVMRSGYKMISLDKTKIKNMNNWNAIWCKHLKINEFAQIGYHQRVNHFPGSFNFGRKDRLWLNLKAKSDKHGHDVFGSFHPETFILPQDYSALSEYWQQNSAPGVITTTSGQMQIVDPKSGDHDPQQDSCEQFNEERKVFICKPPASARGQGIVIVSSLTDLNIILAQNHLTSNTSVPDADSSASKQSNGHKHGSKPKGKARSNLVVQQYISNPCLLQNEAKFDLRVYVLVTSFSPLRIFIHEEGIVRFASNKYSKNMDQIKNQFIHLTNYSVNKNSNEYLANNSADGEDGHKWTLKTLWRYLSTRHDNVDVNQIWASIIDLIIKTVISAESQILALLKQHLKNRKSCFELLGFDIMLDDKFKLWLLEVNITPSLRADTVLDFSVKNQLVMDTLNTVGYQVSPRFRKFYNFGAFIAPDKCDALDVMKEPQEDKVSVLCTLTFIQSNSHDFQHRKYESLYLQSGLSACANLLDSLTEDDLYQLMDSEDELYRKGNFTRIFPAANSRQYLPYFDFPYYYNLLLILWEEKYHQQREAAIARIRSLMMAKPLVQEVIGNMKVNNFLLLD